MSWSKTLRMGARPYLDERRRLLEKSHYEHIELRPMSPVIGAEIGGVDLGDSLDDTTFAEIERAHLEYRVIFFRDQRIDSAQQMAFAARFGELEEHPFIPANQDVPEVIRFEKGENMPGVENTWHSDVSWREAPSLGSILRALDVPRLGGDTLFSDMVAAYACLDDATRERIEGRKAVHDFTHSFGRALSPGDLAEKQKEYPAVEHPIVRIVPETGEKALYVNAIFTSHIVDMDEQESAELLDQLYLQAMFPEYQCRFRWEKDSIAFWDNRVVQHYAANDYWPNRRVMDRVTIIGDRPV